MPGKIYNVVEVPDVADFKTTDTLELEESVKRYGADYIIISRVSDNEEHFFEVSSEWISEIPLSKITFVWLRKGFGGLKELQGNWAINISGNILVGETPKVCLEKMFNWLISVKEHQIELLRAIQHLPELHEPTEE